MSMDSFKTGSRVTLKFFPDSIVGRVRYVDSGVAHVFWEDGGSSFCPCERLILLSFFEMDRYPWEKPREEKPEQEIITKTDEELDLTVTEATQQVMDARKALLEKWQKKHNANV